MAERLRHHQTALTIGVAVGAIALAVAAGALGLGVFDNDRAAAPPPPPRPHVYTLAWDDEVVDPRTGTHCIATGEGGLPNLLCEHKRNERHEVVFWSDNLQVYGPASQPMTPTYSFTWWGGSSCQPPRGPGDTAVHSTNLIAHDISCVTARTVALACARYTYGRSGTCSAAGTLWACGSTREGGARSAQRCVAGRRSMTVVWTD